MYGASHLLYKGFSNETSGNVYVLYWATDTEKTVVMRIPESLTIIAPLPLQYSCNCHNVKQFSLHCVQRKK